MARPVLPLTDFLVGMMRCPTEKLRGMNVEMTAAKYGIRPDWAKYYVNQELISRRL